VPTLMSNIDVAVGLGRLSPSAIPHSAPVTATTLPLVTASFLLGRLAVDDRIRIGVAVTGVCALPTVEPVVAGASS
jgi:hypothetical protein